MALPALLWVPSVLGCEMEPPCFPGEEGIHGHFALQLLIEGWSNISNSLLSPFVALMENAWVVGAPAGARCVYGGCICLFVH